MRFMEFQRSSTAFESMLGRFHWPFRCFRWATDLKGLESWQLRVARPSAEGAGPLRSKEQIEVANVKAANMYSASF